MVWTSAVLITIFRLAVRLSQTRRLQSDDIWIIVATVCLTALAALNQTSRAGTYLMIASMAGEPPKPPFTTAERIAAELESQRYQQFFAMFLFWTTLWSVKASRTFAPLRSTLHLSRHPSLPTTTLPGPKACFS